MPKTPTKPHEKYDIARGQRLWKELCDAQKKQRDLEKAVQVATLNAKLHTIVVQNCQNNYDDFMRG